jgi:hypothetical protein
LEKRRRIPQRGDPAFLFLHWGNISHQADASGSRRHGSVGAKEQTMNTKHGLFIGIAVLLLSAIFTFTGCSDDSGDDGGGGGGGTPTPPPAVTSGTIYTLNGTTFTEYTGTGTAQTVTAVFQGNGSKDFGEVGTISADGKLTLKLPDTVSDDKLFDFQDNCKMGQLHTRPFLYLYKDASTRIMIQYFNKSGSASGNGQTMSWTAGWNYFNGNTKVTDISGYKWVLE